jgi:uncharacterized repeat protein (TIGR01451 family)
VLAANVIALPALTAAGSTANNFGEKAGLVSGSVINASTSAGIGGQTITLAGRDAAGNTISITTTTNPDGTFSFVGVPQSGPSGYTLTQPDQPAGTFNGTTVPGSTGGVGSNPTATSSQITGVSVVGATPSINNIFKETTAIDIATSTTGRVETAGNGVFTVILTNGGTTAAPNVKLTTQLPAGLSEVTVSGGGVYNPATGLVTWPSVPSLASGDSLIYLVTVPLTAGIAVSAQTNVQTYFNPGDTVPLVESNLINNRSQAQLLVDPMVVPTLSNLGLALLMLLMLGGTGLLVRRDGGYFRQAH